MRPNRPFGAAIWMVGLMMSLATGEALASEQDAKTLFAKGRELRAGGKCEEAITAFRKALELFPSGLGALRNIAECEEKIGQLASARRDYWDLRRAALQTNEPKYDGWERDAERAYNALESRVPKIVIKLVGEALERVKVVVDGSPLDPRLVGTELERDLGQHVVEVFFDGVTPITERVTLKEGDRQVITLRIPPPATTLPKPETPTPARTTGNPLRTAGIVSLGVGGAGAIATAVSLIVRAGALSEIEETCPNYELERCPASLRDRYETGVTASTLANVFGGVAIAGLGAGVALVFASGGSSPGAPSGAPSGTPAVRSTVSATLEVAPIRHGAEARATVRF